MHEKTSSTGEKGAVFERLTQLYLQTAPEYQSELEQIWTLREVPPDVRKLLALPALDEGIDFIARTRQGCRIANRSLDRNWIGKRDFAPGCAPKMCPTLRFVRNASANSMIRATRAPVSLFGQVMRCRAVSGRRASQ
jgi:hypothetical protein